MYFEKMNVNEQAIAKEQMDDGEIESPCVVDSPVGFLHSADQLTSIAKIVLSEIFVSGDEH